jgi:hypothetical protein
VTCFLFENFPDRAKQINLHSYGNWKADCFEELFQSLACLLGMNFGRGFPEVIKVPEIASLDCIELRPLFDKDGRVGRTICGANGWGLTDVVSFDRLATIPCSCDNWVLMLSSCFSLRVDTVSLVHRPETKQRVLTYYLFDMITR